MHALRALGFSAALAVAFFANAPRGIATATAEAKAYTARGVVKSFGPDRAFVNIAHEAIPGFMGAMTMPFEARDPKQLAGFEKGDAVRFRFTVEDGRMRLDWIQKQ